MKTRILGDGLRTTGLVYVERKTAAQSAKNTLSIRRTYHAKGSYHLEIYRNDIEARKALVEIGAGRHLPHDRGGEG